jgi:O-acetyl-ADP-ribose deacetylase (regulator of RNase III)
MPLIIVKGDITKIEVDAIVNAAYNPLICGGGVNGAIHRAAGHKLLDECRTLGGCDVGDAIITKGYDVPAKYIIHTTAPIWKGGEFGEDELLKSCYVKSLELAKNHGFDSVAFPLISAGTYGCSKHQVLQIAISVIGDFLLENDMTVGLIIYDRRYYGIPPGLRLSINNYINNHYDSKPDEFISYIFEYGIYLEPEYRVILRHSDEYYTSLSQKERSKFDFEYAGGSQVSRVLSRLMEEKGKSDVEVCRKANLDKRLFSIIKGNPIFVPWKPVVLALAIALELNLDETGDFLNKSGYRLKHKEKADLLIEYFIAERIHNIFEINAALFAFEQYHNAYLLQD